MAHSSHKQYKGCQMCKPHKNRRHGDTARTPIAVLRKLGVSARYSRHAV